MGATDRDRPIGVFDSGVGGLTVMRALVEALPGEDIVYLGDTARVPYGNRAASTVRRYAVNATRTLMERDIKALVVACNTATAHALGTLKETWDIPVIGVVEPVAKRVLEVTETGYVGVMGTRGTVRSDCYPEEIRRLDAAGKQPRIREIHQVACPLLVPLAEEGWSTGSVAEEVASEYLSSFPDLPFDTLVLGCTHYPILRDTLAAVARRRLQREVTLLDSASCTARDVESVLAERGLRARADDSRHEFLLTDLSPAFVEMAERFFGTSPRSMTHVDITEGSN
jgi:glutamate racemase